MNYYRVIGKVGQSEYVLGYTSNKWAWIRNSNGWKKEQLLFEPLKTTETEPIQIHEIPCPRYGAPMLNS